MKIIAFHLPQFHQIPENDQWWAPGFTEWTNTRKTKPSYRDHRQPREPLDDNYYDLSDPSVLRWQAETAARFGIYGFCFYHYWFGGKRLLEKPVEDFLRSKNLDFRYCLAWANEPWTRAWDGQSQEVLIQQEYGGEEEWGRHFECLLRFFEDPRYIRVDDCPVFVIYRSSSIPDGNKMAEYWQQLAQDAGLKGLYLVEMMNSFQKISHLRSAKAILEFEPMFTLTHHYPNIEKLRDRIRNILFKRGLNIKSYDRVWKYILSRPKTDFPGKDSIPGGFVDWDNSPRRAAGGLILDGASPKKFEGHFSRLLAKAARNYDSELLFVNAWNEWAEGAYLEPDKYFGWGYLEAIAEAVKRGTS